MAAFLVAGFETTAHSVSWALVGAHPTGLSCSVKEPPAQQAAWCSKALLCPCLEAAFCIMHAKALSHAVKPCARCSVRVLQYELARSEGVQAKLAAELAGAGLASAPGRPARQLELADLSSLPYIDQVAHAPCLSSLSLGLLPAALHVGSTTVLRPKGWPCAGQCALLATLLSAAVRLAHCALACCPAFALQVWREALRLHPVASIGPIRQADRDVTLKNGLHVPKGTMLWTSVAAILTSPNNFTDSQRFWPERWAQPGAVAAADRVQAPTPAAAAAAAADGEGTEAAAGGRCPFGFSGQPTPAGNSADLKRSFPVFSYGPRDCMGQVGSLFMFPGHAACHVATSR